MRSTLGLALLIAVAGGAAGAGLILWTRASGDRGSPADASVQATLARLESRLAAIEEHLQSGPWSTAPVLRGASDASPPPHDAVPVEIRDAEGQDADESPAAAEAEPPATMEEVRAYLADKLDEERKERRSRFQVSLGDAGDAKLKDVAAALGIDEFKTAKIQEIFKNEGEAQLEAVFATDDIDAIRQRIQDAKSDSLEKTRLQDELLRSLMTSLPRLRRAEEAKNAALEELLGPTVYARFHAQSVREADVDEFDALLEDVLGTTVPEGVSPER